jgi:hypothetical protein
MSWADGSGLVISAAREIEFRFMSSLKHDRSTSVVGTNTSNGLIRKRAKPCLTDPLQVLYRPQKPAFSSFSNRVSPLPADSRNNLQNAATYPKITCASMDKSSTSDHASRPAGMEVTTGVLNIK